MFDIFKTKPNIYKILFDIAKDLNVYTQDLLATHAQIAYDLRGAEADEAEMKLFSVSIAVIIGKQFAVGSSSKKTASLEKLIKLYVNAISWIQEHNGYKIKPREISKIYKERERTYKILIDRCFSQHDSDAPHQLATILYGHVFGPDDKPGDGIGPALVGYIYKLAANGKIQLQGNL